MQEYSRLLKFIKPYRWIFVVAVACMVISTVFSGLQLGMIIPLVDNIFTGKGIPTGSTRLPVFIKDIIIKINSLGSLELLKIIALVIPLVILIKCLSDFGKTYFMSDISQRVIRDIKNKLYRKFQSLSLDFYSRQRTGELTSRITNDVTAIQNSISENLADLVYQSLQVVLFLLIVFFIHWRLASICLVLLPLVMFPVIKIIRKLRKISKNTQEKMADISSMLVETISGIRIVKAFSMESYEINKFNKLSDGLYKLMMKSIRRMAAIAPITEFIGAAMAMFVFYYGARQVMGGVFSFGVFSFFLAALLSLMKPIKKLSRVQAVIQQTLAAAARIFEILDLKPTITEKTEAVTLNPLQRCISFNDIHFSYDNNKVVLSNINLDVSKGEIVAIVGPSGTGKTSLVNLLPRFYDPNKGRVAIDDCDIRDVTLSSVREQIGLVSQETILFNDTVRANIAYGRIGTSDDKIIEASRMANAHCFILELENGYDAIIGERGTKLSGGEKQRLAIARAILKNPPILILDEATSQLDTESEKLVQEAIDRLMKGRTVFVIAHRLSTVKNATRIIVLDKGEIVEQGRHAELISKGGLYKKLYEMQFESTDANK
ncbi:MAG: ABC transporter ATP-binding protein [Candidatus Omnitrophota bacterium]|nr:ABC transporter ATP-binding protein [Candidatus Omnitrophota bacterium]